MQVIIDEIRAATKGKPLADLTPICNAWLQTLCDIVSEWPSAITAAKRGSRFDGVQDAYAKAAAIAEEEAATAASREARQSAQRIVDAIKKRAHEYELAPETRAGGPTTDLLGRRQA